MKKVFTLLFCLLIVITAFVGCESEEVHTHTFADEWRYDENNHWHHSTCEHTDEVSEKGAHVDEDSNDICDVCGYISDHTHTTLREPIVVNDTIIVAAGDYGRYLGVVKLNGDGSLKSYELLAVDETVEEDLAIAAMVENYKTAVENDYLSKYGYTFDQILVNNTYKFDTVDEVYDTQHESTLGNLFADAYKSAAEKATGKKVDVALTAAGVIRATMPIGDISVSDVFNAASLGVGTEGELVSIYITGKDLKNAIELDASVQPLMASAQLFMSGVEYSFNRYRMIFNKVEKTFMDTV